IELRDDDGAARELDAHRDALGPDGEHARQNNHPREDDRVPPPAEEVVVGVLEYVHNSRQSSVVSLQSSVVSRQILSAGTLRLTSSNSKSVFETKIDVNRFDARPSDSV